MDDNGMVTVTEAADLCSVSDDTIRRQLWAHRMPNARRDYEPNGPWRIPLGDLISTGLHPRLDALAPQAARGHSATTAPLPHVGPNNAELHQALVEATLRATRAEALAEARAEHVLSLTAVLTGRIAGGLPPLDPAAENEVTS